VFTALPVFDEGRIVGVVMLSRTPRTLADALYGKRWHLLGLAVLLLGSIGGLSALGNFAISRPLRAVTDQAKRTAEGERGAISPVAGPKVREVAELSDALGRMARTLEDRADYIRSFAAHVSHEFKTPLTTIRGSVELLQEHFDSMSQEERTRFLRNLEGESDRLARLVSRLLDLARADVSPGADHAKTIGDTVIARVADGYRESGLAVDAKATEALTLAIADEAMEMILVNLIENAFQHAGPHARVTVSLHRQDDAGVLVVSDDGPGITAANAGRIFTPFFTTARKHGGTGLGLPIVQSLARVHGGAVALLPSSNGATFEVRLPLAG
jgi:signal transduction histidine kinase